MPVLHHMLVLSQLLPADQPEFVTEQLQAETLAALTAFAGFARAGKPIQEEFSSF